jgi:hypothetical protein
VKRKLERDQDRSFAMQQTVYENLRLGRLRKEHRTKLAEAAEAQAAGTGDEDLAQDNGASQH